eukprot:CAMPEP_0170575904 /NCGR_PEP_ID=MMETSP0224-20130122/4111_1 /TAXON_ID=285029 /ORGANISM="Togula jolla, Strain CCCM 725" /LENGTH=52 /DNA_ID=CAMNT_0010898717 /DNA_START=69 /DNA_END=227 /DNA_ORIENTATION=-
MTSETHGGMASKSGRAPPRTNSGRDDTSKPSKGISCAKTSNMTMPKEYTSAL